jgi:anaerobic selenocysteine-containing dehydrogenase
VRGHSNVQGDRTMGVDEKPKPASLDQLKKVFGFEPPRARLGRPRKVDLRGVVEGLLYILRTACPWRLLPHDFPNRSTVQRYFYA